MFSASKLVFYSRGILQSFVDGIILDRCIPTKYQHMFKVHFTLTSYSKHDSSFHLESRSPNSDSLTAQYDTKEYIVCITTTLYAVNPK